MPTKSDFSAAEEIKVILHGRDKTEKEKILRWVSESIGIVAGPTTTLQLFCGFRGTALCSTPRAARAAGDMKTFIAEKAPKMYVQFAAVAAYFYRFEKLPEAQRKDVIVAQDLQTAGRQGRGLRI